MSFTSRHSSALVDRLAATSRRPANLGLVPDGAVSLAMGEPFAETPAPVSLAAVEALQAGRTRYAPVTGSPELRAAVAAHLSGTSGAPVSDEQVVLTHGASAGLAAAILATVDPGELVVVPEPTYSLYADQVAMAGGRVVWVANQPDGRLDLDALAKRMTGARLLVLCNPSNPTGRVVSRADLEALADLTREHGTLLLCDEAYSSIVFDGLDFHSSLGLADTRNVICCGTFSKSFAMTGWRLGYVVASPQLADRVNRVHRTINGSLNTFVQDAALAAFDLPAGFLAEMSLAYQRRRDLVVDRLGQVPFLTRAKPEGAFYAFPGVESPYRSRELADLLATRARVLVRAGSEYGPSGEGYLRLSFATDLATLEEGLDRFVTALTALVS
jgi:aspartate aminotransferase